MKKVPLPSFGSYVKYIGETDRWLKHGGFYMVKNSYANQIGGWVEVSGPTHNIAGVRESTLFSWAFSIRNHTELLNYF